MDARKRSVLKITMVCNDDNDDDDVADDDDNDNGNVGSNANE